MKLFPVDSMVSGLGEDGLPIYDRPFVAGDLRDVYEKFFTTGIFLEPAKAFTVTPAAGKYAVTVAPGGCHINGAFGTLDEKKVLEVRANTGKFPRIDSVVIRLDLTQTNRTCEVMMKEGDADINPHDPGLDRHGGVYELAVADVFVAAGGDTITQTDITDTRMSSARCGIVTPFVPLDTDKLFLQIVAAYKKLIQAYEDALSGELAGELKRYKKSMKIETELEANTDLNTIESAGNYGVTDNRSILNAPKNVDKPYILYVSEFSNTEKSQTIVCYSGKNYFRHKVSGGKLWSDWNSSVPQVLYASEIAKVTISSHWEQVGIVQTFSSYVSIKNQLNPSDFYNLEPFDPDRVIINAWATKDNHTGMPPIRVVPIRKDKVIDLAISPANIGDTFTVGVSYLYRPTS